MTFRCDFWLELGLGLRVKIHDPDKVIPSYIHRRDEGELWSLNFEGRVFCCWKCGSGSHIGDKCRDQDRTFEEVFSSSNDEAGGLLQPTWAAVVRSGQGEESEEYRNRVKEMEARLTEQNMQKQNEKKEAELRRLQAEKEEKDRKNKEVTNRQKLIADMKANALKLMESAGQDKEVIIDEELMNIAESHYTQPQGSISVTADRVEYAVGQEREPPRR